LIENGVIKKHALSKIKQTFNFYLVFIEKKIKENISELIEDKNLPRLFDNTNC
jgi:predicted house-cleaning noncanonical NTP pyrophosphatase (MazG superfamily)